MMCPTVREMGLQQAFAFDHHFEQAGFRIWPGMVL